MYPTIRQMQKHLGQLEKWLETAAAFAQKKSFDPDSLLTFRLAPDQFAFARQIQTACWEGKTMTGADYFVEHAVPNFYFHLTHVYAMLRHNGVEIGKRDYLGTLTYAQPPRSESNHIG
jgi:hypothetical protein